MTDVEPGAATSRAVATIESVKNETWQVWIRKWVGALSPIATLVAAVIAIYFAASPQLKLSQDTAHRQLQAYVGVVIGSVNNVAEKQKPDVVVVFKNYGQTPATAQYSVAARFVDDVSADLPAEPLRPEKFVLFPGNDFSVHFEGDALNAVDIEGLNSGKRPLAIFGRVMYVDAFQKQHQTNFRLLYGDKQGLKRTFWGPTGNSFD